MAVNNLPSYDVALNYKFITDEENKPKVVGRGRYGIAYAARDKHTQLKIVVKEMVIAEDRDLQELHKEISLHSALRHKNIVGYLSSSSQGKCIQIFMEHVPGGAMSTLLRDEWGPLMNNEILMAHYCQQILQGLAYLHDQNIVHRDIKGGNVLINDFLGIAKIADFGISKRLEDMCPAQTEIGTQAYMAPEVFDAIRGYSYPADIWSFGCTVIEMATAKPPFAGLSMMDIIAKVITKKKRPNIPKELSSEAKTFILRCFDRNPQKRSDAKQLLWDPFLTKSIHFQAFHAENSHSNFDEPDLINLEKIFQEAFVNKQHILHYVAAKGDAKMMEYILTSSKGDTIASKIFTKKYDVNINAEDEEGCKALHIAVINNNVSIAKWLIAAHQTSDIDSITTSNSKLTCLQLACQLRDLNTLGMVNYLLSIGSNVNMTDDDECTPLHYATRNNSLSLCTTLIQHNANINAINLEGRTPLHFAVGDKNFEIIKALIENGANLNMNETESNLLFLEGLYEDLAKVDYFVALTQRVLKNGIHQQPEFWKRIKKGDIEKVKSFWKNKNVNLKIRCIDDNKNALQYAIDSEQIEMVKYINELDPTLINNIDGHGSTILHYAAGIANVELFQYSLQLCNNERAISDVVININTERIDGFKALHIAIMSNHLPIVKLLLELHKYGHIDDERNRKYKSTYLSFASQHANVEIVQFLLDRGSSSDVRDWDDDTPLHCAARAGLSNNCEILIKHGANVNAIASRNERYQNRTPLLIASLEGHSEVVHLLLKNGAEINFCDENNVSSLHYAANLGHISTVQELLANNAKVNVLDKTYQTPLFLAARQGHFDIVLKLIDHDADVNICNESNLSPLHCIAMNGYADIALILILNGADVNAVDDELKTPLHMAVELGHFTLIELLMNHGASLALHNINGDTPLELAIKNQATVIIEYLNKFAKVCKN